VSDTLAAQVGPELADFLRWRQCPQISSQCHPASVHWQKPQFTLQLVPSEAHALPFTVPGAQNITPASVGSAVLDDSPPHAASASSAARNAAFMSVHSRSNAGRGNDRSSLPLAALLRCESVASEPHRMGRWHYVRTRVRRSRLPRERHRLLFVQFRRRILLQRAGVPGCNDLRGLQLRINGKCLCCGTDCAALMRREHQDRQHMYGHLHGDDRERNVDPGFADGVCRPVLWRRRLTTRERSLRDQAHLPRHRLAALRASGGVVRHRDVQRPPPAVATAQAPEHVAHVKLGPPVPLRGAEPFAAFLARLEKADAEAEAKAVKVIVDAAQDGTWRAAAWWLERRRPDRWARRETAGAEERARRDEQRLRAASDDELRACVRQQAAAVLTPSDLRIALAEAEARTSGGGGAS
jgi:hypothetical protein